MPETACTYCGWHETDDTTVCPATSKRHGYHCSRPEGHDGPHVACGTSSHQIATWDTDTEDPR